MLCYAGTDLIFNVSAILGPENSQGWESAEACSYVCWFGQADWDSAWKFSESHCRRGTFERFVIRTLGKYYAVFVIMGTLTRLRNRCDIFSFSDSRTAGTAMLFLTCDAENNSCQGDGNKTTNEQCK